MPPTSPSDTDGNTSNTTPKRAGELTPLSPEEAAQLYSELGLDSSSGTARDTDMHAHDRSPYLVKRLTETSDQNLFNYVKFHCVKNEIERLQCDALRVLDIGCGLQVARRYLRSIGLQFDYFGVDYESSFEPDAVVDLLSLDQQMPALPWQPDVLIMLDVLEHLHEDPRQLEQILARLRALCPPKARLILTLPQMYRLDRFKLSHLHYPEHKIRLTQREWCELVSTQFDIEGVRGFGVLSVVPYLPMASKRYRPGNRLGRLFNYLRGTFFEWPPFKPVDLWLSRIVGRVPWLNTFTNDILIVATPKTGFDEK